MDKLDAAAVNALADKWVASATTHSVFSDEGKAILGDIGYTNIIAVSTEVTRRENIAAADAFDTTTPIHLYILEQAEAGVRGFRAPSKVDLSSMKRAAQTTVDQYGKKREPYKPEGKCGLRIDLGNAVLFSYSQEAYADYSTYAVPVKGDIELLEGIEVDRANRNLSNFFKYSDTHTGWAGSGCNWSSSLIITPTGAFVLLTCRASISD